MDAHAITVTWRLVIICVTVFLCWGAYWDYRKRRLQFEERRAAIENGMEPPPLAIPAAAGWPGVKQQELQLKYAERRLRIEKGLPVPLEEPAEPLFVRGKHARRPDYLRRGILFTCVGVGFFLGYVLLMLVPGVDGVDDARAWFLGLAPLALLFGIGNLIYQRFAPEAPVITPKPTT